MTKPQISLYFREWGEVRAHLKAHPGQVTTLKLDDMRHALHVKALGKDKSHTRFTNAEFDKVLGVFRAIHDDANLDAQLRQIDQPDIRRRNLVNRCWDACRVFIHGFDIPHQEAKIGTYIDGVSSKVFHTPHRNLTEQQLGVLAGILEKHAAREQRKHQRAAAENARAQEDRETGHKRLTEIPDDIDEDNPF